MNTLKNAVPAAVLAMSLLTSSPTTLLGNDDVEPLIPAGTLDAFPTLVQTGTHPTLTWDIQYLEKAPDIIDIDDDGTVTPTEDLYVEFRILGASFQSGYDRYGRPNWLDTQVAVRVNGSWVYLFTGTQDEIRPSHIYHSAEVDEGVQLEFAARGHSGSRWYDWHSTSWSSPNVTALVNGDTPPDYAPAYRQGDIVSFMQPYLDSEGKVDIGPKDVLFLWELSTSSPGSQYFDMQDMVVLATFDYRKNN